MATLYVEKFPDELYDALRKRAKSKRTSIAAEVIALIKESVPTEKERRNRLLALKRLIDLQKNQRMDGGPYPTAEELMREERQR